MILLDPGVDESLGPQGGQSKVGGGGGSISGGAALAEKNHISVLGHYPCHLHHLPSTPRSLAYPSRGGDTRS